MSAAAQLEILQRPVARPRPTLRLVGRRLAAVLPVLLGVTLLTFFVVNVLPGGTARQLLGPEATAEQVAQLEAELNLDRPAWERYLEWLGDALTGDLGRSLASEQPVTSLLGERLPVTLQLVAYAFVLAIVSAVLAALLSAYRPNGIFDRSSMLVSLVGLSVPNYVAALLLVLVLAVTWPLFPSIGFTPLTASPARHFQSLALPALAIALPLFGLYGRFLRGDLLEQIQGEGYVLTAAAKGIGRWRILVRHALRNSLLGLLTLVGMNFGTLLGGTVVIEQIFALPGLGQLLLVAIATRDVVVVQGIVLVLAIITVAANLVVDLLYCVLDPRIRDGGS